MYMKPYILLLASTTLAQPCLPAWSAHTCHLFTESMAYLDRIYDPTAGYVFDPSAAAAMRHDTRTSAWYAVGLLARNQADDIDHASTIITNVIGAQFKDPADQWYGDYEKYPEEPTVGTPAYPPVIYDTWDPNWRGFIGTAFIVALEEFPHLLPADVRELMLASLHNNTVGDSYRVGGVDGDNLYPSYTNPALMRALISSWTGHRLSNANMTLAGEHYAAEIISLFERAHTLSEFNSATYTGVSLLALTMWAKYAPAHSLLRARGPDMLSATWTTLGSLYHARLRNLAGPWDRAYGFDMRRYFGIVGAHIWTLVGKEAAPVAERVDMMSHHADFAIAPLVAVLAPFHNGFVAAEVVERLGVFPGEHFVETSAYSPPWDFVPRRVRAWLGERVSIGAESFNETVVGGPAVNAQTFNPAVVQWETGDGSEVGWIALYATERALDVGVGPGVLNLTYPAGTADSQFQFLVSPFARKKDVTGWEDLPGVRVSVSGTVDLTPEVSYSASDATINDFMFWNFTHRMPPNATLLPRISLTVEMQ